MKRAILSPNPFPVGKELQTVFPTEFAQGLGEDHRLEAAAIECLMYSRLNRINYV